MTTKNYNIVESLHELTQNRHKITFSRDFSGMITVTCGNELDNHYHVGIPHQNLKDLEKQLSSFLARLSEELK